MTKVIVAMPVYNCAEYINESIYSLLSQTYSDYTILVYNDGSNDDTLSQLESIKNKRIKILSGSNIGIVGALNHLIENCDSEYIARMDGDDICRPDRLEKQVSAMDSNKKLIVCGSNIRMFGAINKEMHFPKSNQECKSTLFFRNCFAHPSTIIRKSTLVASQLKYEKAFEYAEDYRLWTELSSMGDFFNIQQCLVDYRVHDSQISSTKIEMQRNAHCKTAADYLQKIECKLSEKEINLILWPGGMVDRKIYMALIMDALQAIKNSKAEEKILISKVLLKIAASNFLKI